MRARQPADNHGGAGRRPRPSRRRLRWRAQLRQSARGADRNGRQHQLDVDGADHHGVRAEHSADDLGRPRRTRRRRPRPRRSPPTHAPTRRRFRRRRFRPPASGTRSSRATRCSGSPRSSTSSCRSAVGERAQRELADRARATAQRAPGWVGAGPRSAQPPPSTAPPAGTAAPPATTAARPAPTAAPTPTAGADGSRPGRRRRSPRRPVASSRGRPGDVPGAGLRGGRRHADRVLARQRARPQPGDGLAV